jgi:DNA polymerase III subunit delta'
MPFRDLAGHRHLRELLSSAAVRGTLTPSLILSGPPGVGKRTAAIALAQLVNCPHRDAADACGRCASCTRIARGVHADVLVVEPGETGAIKVDQVRDVVERTAYRPFEGRRRVVIIDDADAMLAEAQNALLKTLEEPPQASMFVLVTARPDVLLPTVRSRCQQLRFGRLSADEIAAVLVEAHGYEPAAARAAAAAADGSVGQAIEGGADGFVDARDAATDVLRAVAATRDPRRRLDSAKVLAGGGDRDDVRRRLRALASLVRDLGALSARAEERHLTNVDHAGVLRQLSASFDRERVAQAFAAVVSAIDAIDRNASPKIVADWLAFQL